MGELIDGQWRRGGFESVLTDGALKRPPSVFRNWVTPDGTAAPSGRGFEAQCGRYHLYVSLACPWAHRTLIMRNVKGLQDMIGVSIVHWHMGDDGWTFAPGPNVISDPIARAAKLHEIYTLSDRQCTSRVTVPVLFDVAEKVIVSNESSDIMRMFNTAFDQLGALLGDYYPESHRTEIDEVNARIYDTLNNGVYKAGFATKQAAYELAVADVFETLEWLESRLTDRRYLVGDTLTEADIRLFTTLVRFDPVYFGHFKCNRRALVDYPALWTYVRALAQHPGIGPTIDLDHIKKHYYGSHTFINPTGIVPVGPDLDLSLSNTLTDTACR